MKVQVLGVVVDAIILVLGWLRQTLREVRYHESLWWKAGAHSRSSVLTQRDGFLILGH